MNGRQRTGARGIDDAIRSMQIQAIRDAPSDNVSEQPRERILLPGDIAFRDSLDDVIGDIIRDTRVLQSFPPFRMAQSSPQRNDHFQSPGNPENAPDSGTIKLATSPVASVFQSTSSPHQSEQLRSIDRFQVIGRNPVFEWIEWDGRKKSASPGVRHVRRLLIRIKIVVGIPVSLGDFCNRIDTTADVRPELIEIFRLGEQSTQADDRQRWLLGLICRHTHVFWLSVRQAIALP